MNIKKLTFVLMGFLCLGLGTVGIFLPILPTVPFYMATAFLFGCSSKRFHSWFIKTDVYKKHLESFVQKKGMTVKTKTGILGMVTIVMGAGFFMMKSVPIGRIILAIVWISHMVYFIFGVKTLKEEPAKKVETQAR